LPNKTFRDFSSPPPVCERRRWEFWKGCLSLVASLLIRVGAISFFLCVSHLFLVLQFASRIGLSGILFYRFGLGGCVPFSFRKYETRDCRLPLLILNTCQRVNETFFPMSISTMIVLFPLSRFWCSARFSDPSCNSLCSLVEPRPVPLFCHRPLHRWSFRPTFCSFLDRDGTGFGDSYNECFRKSSRFELIFICRTFTGAGPFGRSRISDGVPGLGIPPSYFLLTLLMGPPVFWILILFGPDVAIWLHDPFRGHERLQWEETIPCGRTFAS